MLNEHLIVETNEEYKFLKVTCSEGHYISNWDKEDILNYSSSIVMYCPLSTDLSGYYCITEEENTAYIEQQIKAQEEKRLAEEKAIEERNNKYIK